MTEDAKIDRFRRNLLKATGIAGAALLATAAVAKPASARGPGGPGGGPGGPGGPGGGPGGDDGRCFLRGTRIRTADGYRAIETLSVGDQIATRFGGVVAIKAIDSFSVTTTGSQHEWLGHLRPVWVKRGALADNVPSTDLCLTAAHAIYVDGYLVPVGHLVNGMSIVFDVSAHSEPLAFYHIELDHHDLLDADGAACETLRAIDVQPCAPLLNFNGAQSEIRSRLRSATSILIDRRQPIDLIRDSLEARGLRLACAA